MKNKLKYYRTIVHDYTIRELAEKSGVSRATITALENEPEKAANTSTLESLAEAVGASVGDVFFTE